MHGAQPHQFHSECQVPGNMDVPDERVGLNPIWKDEQNKKVVQMRDIQRNTIYTDSDAT